MTDREVLHAFRSVRLHETVGGAEYAGFVVDQLTEQDDVFRRAHRLQNLLGLCLHPVRKSALVVAHVVGDADNGHPQIAPVPLSRIEVQEIIRVR